LLASVIIVEYSSRQFLPDCLSALEKTLLPRGDFEVLVVDNASPTPVADLAARFPRVRFLTSRRNLGFAGGNALGLHHARGTHVALLNPDAIPTPSWLGEILAPLGEPSVGIVGSKLLHPGTEVLQHAGGMLRNNGLSEHFGRGELDHGQWDARRDVAYVCGAALAVSREVIERVGFLSPAYFPAYYEETELCVRARRAGFRVVYAPKAVAYHHEGASSGSAGSNAYLARFHESRIRFVLRNYSAAELLSRFAPSELAWLRRSCPPAERRVCARSYLSALRTAWNEQRGSPGPDDVVADSDRGARA
jgi:GT2 family glycosyltransferase